MTFGIRQLVSRLIRRGRGVQVNEDLESLLFEGRNKAKESVDYGRVKFDPRHIIKRNTFI